MTHSASQRGSSFFLILLGIAIFAALSFAVLQGGRVSQSSLSGDQARLAAQDIIQYADTVAKAVQTLRLRGCSDTQISFAGHPNGATNPSAPTDESCHVFSLSGGKVNAKIADSNYYNTGNNWSGQWRFTGDDDLIGIGTNGCSDNSCAELIMTLYDVKQDICAAIEKIAAENTTIPTENDAMLWNSFAGTYNATPEIVGDDTGGVPMRGRGSGCFFEDGGANAYVYYQVLIAR